MDRAVASGEVGSGPQPATGGFVDADMLPNVRWQAVERLLAFDFT
jgi:hypothetical protein